MRQSSSNDVITWKLVHSFWLLPQSMQVLEDLGLNMEVMEDPEQKEHSAHKSPFSVVKELLNKALFAHPVPTSVLISSDVMP